MPEYFANTCPPGFYLTDDPWPELVRIGPGGMHCIRHDGKKGWSITGRNVQQWLKPRPVTLVLLAPPVPERPKKSPRNRMRVVK
jgi:hypothetical protein